MLIRGRLRAGESDPKRTVTRAEDSLEPLANVPTVRSSSEVVEDDGSMSSSWLNQDVPEPFAGGVRDVGDRLIVGRRPGDRFGSLRRLGA
jgi:hypothetical protein